MIKKTSIDYEQKGHMELRHLRYFLAVAGRLSFRQAASDLNIAQPALSQQIQALEKIVGAQLFERTSRSVKLTQAGALFLREAEQTIQQSERAKIIAERAGRGELGRIVIAYAGSTLYSGLLSKYVQKFHKQYPSVRIEVEEIGIEEQIEQIERGAIDIGIIRLPVDLNAESLKSTVLLEEPIMLAVPGDHPLAQKIEITIQELAKERLISSQSDRVGMLRQVLDVSLKHSVMPEIVHARHFGAILGLVSAGMGVAVVPESAEAIHLSGIVYRRLLGVAHSQVAMLSRVFEVASPVKAFLEIVSLESNLKQQKNMKKAVDGGQGNRKNG